MQLSNLLAIFTVATAASAASGMIPISNSPSSKAY